jgi:hypothetical protein
MTNGKLMCDGCKTSKKSSVKEDFESIIKRPYSNGDNYRADIQNSLKVVCPKCHATPGEECEAISFADHFKNAATMPNAGWPHKERLEAAKYEFPSEKVYEETDFKCSFCNDNKYVPEPLPTKDLGNGKFETGSKAVPCKYCNKNGKEIGEKDKNMNEALTPKRENSGLNGAARGWANSPNEQIAGWRALVDDADGPNKPKEAYPNRLGDNPIKVADNKKDEPLHENKEINTIAEKLSKKFSALNESSIDAKAIKNFDCPKCKAKKGNECHTVSGERIVFPHEQRVKKAEKTKKVTEAILTENEALYAAKQLNFKHVERKLEEAGFRHNPEKEAEINHAAHIFTGDNGTFVSISKDGKWDWAYHHDETLDEGQGKASLLDLIYSLSDNEFMNEYNSEEWEPEAMYPYDQEELGLPSLEDELEVNRVSDNDKEFNMLEDREADRQKALDAFLNQNEKSAKVLDKLNNKPNPFSVAAKRMGRVSKDYKPVGVPVREK